MLDLPLKFVSNNSVKIRAFPGLCNTNSGPYSGIFTQSPGRNFGVFANFNWLGSTLADPRCIIGSGIYPLVRNCTYSDEKKAGISKIKAKVASGTSPSDLERRDLERQEADSAASDVNSLPIGEWSFSSEIGHPISGDESSRKIRNRE
jgi:hypothetical protein